MTHTNKMRILTGVAMLAALTSILTHPVTANNSRQLLNTGHPVPTRTLAYGTLPGQFGELWLPAGHGLHPVVVMIHGGCWLASQPGAELMAYIAEDMRKSGVAVWNIEYRRLGTPGAGYPGTFLDIASGMDYLRRIAQQNQLDLNRVVVLGHSAGGQLALWAAARRRVPHSSPLYRKNALPVRVAISLAGVNDLAAYRSKGPANCGPHTIDALVNAKGRKNQDYFADTSPAAMLPLGVEQVIVAGDADPIVPAGFANDYAAAAQKAGDKVETMNLHGADHFVLIDPRTREWAQIKTSLLAHLK